MIILPILFFVTAILYSSVGFGGGSTYLALLLIWEIPYYILPVIALGCNIIVVSGNSINYIKAGNLNLKLLTPYLIGSVPMAFIGGTLEIEKNIFEILLFFVLLVSGLLLLFNFKSYDDNENKYKEIKYIYSLFIGSILGLVLAYFVRFYSLSCNGIKSSYEKINKTLDETAYLAGYSKLKTFLNIHIPYLRSSIFFVIILISLEIIRELPITLILRPFNFETFATTAYIYASQDLLEAAAVPSLFLVLIASLFILLISRYILKEENE